MSLLRTARVVKSASRIPSVAATRAFHSPFTVLGAPSRPQPTTVNAYSEQADFSSSTSGSGVYVVSPSTGEFHHVPTGAFAASVPYSTSTESTGATAGPRYKSKNSAFAHPLSARTVEDKTWKAKN
ncbi:hypothetical protein V5O48_008382 [Marasmius crinis-equi]|uniref:Uncharacterized protein n=1 Tax=Marasmius crinis-equi TaxID=585013 RepID=A0ABR3FE16_9AGAR